MRKYLRQDLKPEFATDGNGSVNLAVISDGIQISVQVFKDKDDLGRSLRKRSGQDVILALYYGLNNEGAYAVQNGFRGSSGSSEVIGEVERTIMLS